MRRGPDFRGGTTLVEVLLASCLSLLVVGMVAGVASLAGRHGKHVEGIEDALGAFERVRTLWTGDLLAVPDPSTLEIERDRLEADLPTAIGPDERPRFRKVAYRIVGDAGARWLLRNGKSIAGPLVDAGFQAARDQAGRPVARIWLVASVSGSAAPVALSLEVGVAEEPPAPGLIDWRIP